MHESSVQELKTTPRRDAGSTIEPAPERRQQPIFDVERTIEETQCALRRARLCEAAPKLYASLVELVNSPNAKENAVWNRARAAIRQAGQ